MKAAFYPRIKDKNDLFKQGYIAKQSGHSRGSTVDLTIAAVERVEKQPPYETIGPHGPYCTKDRLS